MKNVKNIKPKKFVFSRELIRQVSGTLTPNIIRGFNGYLFEDSPLPWKTTDWIDLLEEHIDDYDLADDYGRVNSEIKNLRRYLTKEAKFDFIVIND